MATIDTNGSSINLGGGDGFGANNNVLMFLIFAMIFGNGGFGGWGNGNGNSNAIQNDINRGFDNQNTMANQREILSAVTAGTAQSVAATNQSFHDTLAALTDKYGELQRDIAAVQVSQAEALANQNRCCCETLRAIDGVNYNGALNTAAIKENATAIGQKILDKLNENENKALQNRVNQLELAQALVGVPRYQPGITYGAVPSPLGNPGFGYPYYPVAA